MKDGVSRFAHSTDPHFQTIAVKTWTGTALLIHWKALNCIESFGFMFTAALIKLHCHNVDWIKTYSANFVDILSPK